MEEKVGSIKIAPGVVRTVVALTTLAIPGVVSLGGGLANEVKGLLSSKQTRGVKVQVKDDALLIDVHVVLESGANMLQVGNQIQKEVTQAVDQMIGMPVLAVNVYIQDVR